MRSLSKEFIMDNETLNELKSIEDNADEVLEDLEEIDEEEVFIPSGVYQNNKTKALENKSSAYSLFIVGLLGSVVVALSWFERLPFSIGGSRNLMSHAVLFVFFVIFVVCGIVSAINAKKYKDLVHVDEDMKETISAYLSEHFTKDLLEEITDESEESAYFVRMSYMREIIKESLSEESINETLLEAVLDEYYDKLFG